MQLESKTGTPENPLLGTRSAEHQESSTGPSARHYASEGTTAGMVSHHSRNNRRATTWEQLGTRLNLCRYHPKFRAPYKSTRPHVLLRCTMIVLELALYGAWAACRGGVAEERNRPDFNALSVGRIWRVRLVLEGRVEAEGRTREVRLVVVLTEIRAAAIPALDEHGLIASHLRPVQPAV